MRKAFTVHARTLAARLGFRQRSSATRYAIIILTFACSAVLHIASAPVPLRCGIFPQFRFYATVIAAIVAEDFALRAVGALLAQKSSVDRTAREKKDLKPAIVTPRTCERQPIRSAEDAAEDETPSLWLRLVGHAWVACFFLWAGSKLIYHTQMCMYGPAHHIFSAESMSLGKNATMPTEFGNVVA